MVDEPIASVMKDPLPVVKESATFEQVSALINHDTPAVLVELANGKYNIVTRYDIIAAIA